MRHFLKLTLLFSLLLLVVAALLVEVPEHYLSGKADFKLPANTKHIVVGHSHSECAIDDSFIEDLTNVSESGEAYFYTYLKTREILKQNPSIETVFIEFTNNQIAPIMDDWTWDDEHLNHWYPKYSTFMGVKDKFLIASNNFSGYVSSNSLSSSENIKRILTKNHEYINPVRANKLWGDPHLLDSLIIDATKKKKTKKNAGLSNVNLTYLNKLIQLCKKEGKRVILIRSPLHEKYQGLSNESIYQKLRKNRFSDLEYYDFSKFPLDNSNFYDLEHLNEKGARTLSKWFDEILNDTNALQSDSEEFVKSEMLKFTEVDN